MNTRKSIFMVIGLATLLGLGACNPTNIQRNSKLEDALLYYKIQMNRSNFLEAAQFRTPDSRWDVRGLDRFQVTHYEIKQSVTKDGGQTIERMILLRYIDRHTMRERETLYTEIWTYDRDKVVWLLSGEPPQFR